MIHKIRGWVIGISIIFLGLIFILDKVIFGLLLIIMGITFIPLFRDWLKKITKKDISFKLRQPLYSVFVMILIAVFINSVIAEKNAMDRVFKEKIEKERLESIQRKAELLKKKSKDFKNNKDKILSRAKIFIKNKQYKDGLIVVNYYESTNDKDLLALKKEIQTIQKDIHKKKRTKEILLKLKKLPVSKINDNYNLYKELSKLHPNNKKYPKKMKLYADKIAKVEAKKIAEKIFYGDKPTKSSYDGSYPVVKFYLRQAMHDPSSLDINNCSSVYKIEDKGWAVKCSYRGKNAFGGIVLNSNWFIIRQNTVINVESSDTYSVSY